MLNSVISVDVDLFVLAFLVMFTELLLTLNQKQLMFIGLFLTSAFV